MKRNRSVAMFSLLGAVGFGCGVDADISEPVQEDQAPLYAKRSAIWNTPNTIIPVCWEPGAGPSNLMNDTRTAIEATWGSASAVDFMGWGPCNSNSSGIRIQVSDERPHTTALGSELDGRTAGMVLNLSFKNWSQSCQSTLWSCVTAIAVHEFGHALGFAHEQNRPDAPTSCTTAPNDAPSGEDGDAMIGAWDINSVMNYCNPVWNNGGVLSSTDAIGVRMFYAGNLWKWYSNLGQSPDFTFEPEVGGNKGILFNGDWNGDGHVDLISLRQLDGRFQKYYSPSGTSGSSDFNRTAAHFIGGSPGVLPGATFIPGDFNGDGRTDLVVFRSSDGYFGKWYSANTTSIAPEFEYQAARYVGGAPGVLPGATLIPGDFNGDGYEDLVVFRSSDGYFGKWYGSATKSADFQYQAARYIGGAPGVLPGATLIPGDFNGDGFDDILVFRSSDGYVGKWYGSKTVSADFVYTPPVYIGGTPGNFPGATAIVGDFDGNTLDDVVIFRSSDGYVGKWYSTSTAMVSGFQYMPAVYIGGAPGNFPGATLLKGDFDGDHVSDLLIFRPSDGYASKWYGTGTIQSAWTYEAARYIGGAPGTRSWANLGVIDFNGDGLDDVVGSLLF